MIDKLPKCLQTCFHCWHAIFREEYSRYSRRIIFEGCWKDDSIRTPVDRENCDKFEEDPERIKRDFWKKWGGYIYVDDGGHPGDGREHLVNYEAFRKAEELLPAGKLPTIEELPTAEELKSAKEEQIEDEQIEDEQIEDEQIEDEQIEDEQANNKNAPPDIVNVGKKSPTTRSLILQALSHNISRLGEITDFAGVHPSTAHYHLRNLIREGRVQKISRGVYSHSGGHSLKNGSHFFESFLKNGSHLCREVSQEIALHPLEKSILMEILSKENKYEQFSERELARRCRISRNTVKKYTLKLEKKKLIKIKREKNQHIFTPTKVAIHGLTEFFRSVKSGSKTDSESSKSEPVYEPVSGSIELRECADPVVVRDEPVPSTGSDVLETFDDYIAWQQKNAHRFIIQFKLIRCSHNRLKKSGWIFGKKSIHKHLTEAYIYKSKDPSREIINVLPKDPFIFTSEIDFHTKMIDFVNEVIDRLREYGIVIDLSEPAEIRMQHEAIEDDPFARKVIEKGLLYFKSKTKVIDSTGEGMVYVTAIDKSKKLHFEFEGTEAHLLTANLDAFVDDVVSGKINSKDLREMPQRLENVQNRIKNGFGEIEERLNSSIHGIQNTQTLLHQNQLEFSQNLVSHTEMVQRIGEAAESVRQAADTIKEVAKVLIDVMNSSAKGFRGGIR